jgi:hypothetical protein
MKIDPYKHKEKYMKWKAKGSLLFGLNKSDSDLIKKYIEDMEMGMNVAKTNKKGARGFSRLNAIRSRMVFIANHLKNRFGLNDITKVTEEQVHKFFNDMRNGNIKKANGMDYTSPKFYVKDFKSFWHWYQRKSRKEGKSIEDITVDLDTSGDKPRWVYLTEEEVKRLYNRALFDYKVLIMFLFDTGIRAPTELMNVRVSDISPDFKELNIREETSKTFGRRIKLMLCSDLLKEHTKYMDKSDYLFKTNPVIMNRYLKRLVKKVLEDKESPAGERYYNITMYDFRHIACCYWLLHYKSESALMYRFGWKKSDKVHYYSEFLGMRDTIGEEDLMVDVTKTDIENRLDQTEREKNILQDRLNSMEQQMTKLLEVTGSLAMNVK